MKDSRALLGVMVSMVLPTSGVRHIGQQSRTISASSRQALQKLFPQQLADTGFLYTP